MFTSQYQTNTHDHQSTRGLCSKTMETKASLKKVKHILVYAAPLNAFVKGGHESHTRLDIKP